MKKEHGFVKAKLILRGGVFSHTPRYTSIKKYLGINRVKDSLTMADCLENLSDSKYSDNRES